MLQYTCINIYLLSCGSLEGKANNTITIRWKSAQLDPPIYLFIMLKIAFSADVL